MDFTKAAVLMPDDVVTPREASWAPFTHCVYKLTSEWDVMQNALSSGFDAEDPEFARFKVIEYTLANFADAWNKKKQIDPAEVSNFLHLTMDDFFGVDVASAAYPLASVLVRIYHECLQGITTGVDTVVERIKAQNAVSPRRNNTGSVTEVTQQLKEVSMDTKEEQQGRGEKVGAVEGDKGDVKSGVAQGKVDEDGWETVTSKRRGRRKK